MLVAGHQAMYSLDFDRPLCRPGGETADLLYHNVKSVSNLCSVYDFLIVANLRRLLATLCALRLLFSRDPLDLDECFINEQKI
jgi:hypothetical protein